MRMLSLVGGRLTIVCACGHAMSGHQLATVMDAVKDHESFTHGKGLSVETHAALRSMSRV